MIKVYGHPRSGCNFAVNFIASAFYPEIAKQTEVVWTGHWSNRVQVEVNARELWGNHGFWHGHANCVYVIRDVRDVALSLYRTKQFQHRSWHDLSFDAFIREPLDWYGTPGRESTNGLVLNIIEHWNRHVESWRDGENVLYVRYNRLVESPDRTIDRIAEFVGQEPIAEPDMSLAGPFPSNDIRIQKWDGVMSWENLDFIRKHCSEDTWRVMGGWEWHF